MRGFLIAFKHPKRFEQAHGDDLWAGEPAGSPETGGKQQGGSGDRQDDHRVTAWIYPSALGAEQAGPVRRPIPAVIPMAS